jgi:hypothetical protein
MSGVKVMLAVCAAKAEAASASKQMKSSGKAILKCPSPQELVFVSVFDK